VLDTSAPLNALSHKCALVPVCLVPVDVFRGLSQCPDASGLLSGAVDVECVHPDGFWAVVVLVGVVPDVQDLMWLEVQVCAHAGVGRAGFFQVS
jgi:hypothetical protein